MTAILKSHWSRSKEITIIIESKSQKCANDISQSIANKTWEFHSLLLLTPVLILTVKSTTDTSGTGTLKAIPVSLL
jgi:hypothetical protein